jgi:hypothetical protein
MKPFAVVLFLAAISSCAASGSAGTPQIDARTAFDAPRDVEGDWSGEVLDGPWINEGAGGEGVEQAGEARLVEGRYHVTAGGRVVEATLFKGTPREMVMMFHLDGRKLMLTQYGEAENSATLVGDKIGPTFPEPPSWSYLEILDENGTTVQEHDFASAAPQSPREPNGVFIHLSLAGAAKPDPSGGEYLHHVFMLINKDGTRTSWTFYEDGAPTRVVYVELTQKNSLQTAAAVSQPNRRSK